MQLELEDRLILLSIKKVPSLIELEQINNLIPLIHDWDYLITTLIDRGIGPLFFNKLPFLSNNTLIPEVVKTILQQVYYKTFSRSTILHDHFRKIAEAFNKHNIQVIALKGIFLSQELYQDIGLRQFSDIDLLVKEEDASSCLSILDTMGYKPVEFKVSEFVRKNTETIHFPPMVNRGVSIEIHIKLHKNTESYHLDIVEIWKNAVPVTVDNIPVYALNTNDLLIHLCVHLDKHFRSENVQFTCFNDITNYLEKYAEIIDWNSFILTCQKYNCENIVFKYIVLVHKYMNAIVPESIIQKYSYLLKEKDEQLFINLLKGEHSNSIIKNYMASLSHVKGLHHKINFVFDIVFPPKAFMIQLYKIKNPTLVLFYYPYRHFIGIKAFLIYIKKLF